MPVFRSSQPAPHWCELEHFDIVRLQPGSSHTFDRIGIKEKLIVVDGSCRVCRAAETVDASEGANLDLSGADDRFEVVEAVTDCTLVRMAGRWKDETGGSGLFTVVHGDPSRQAGDPVDYPKQTTFDNHFHDCDECWIVVTGSGVAASEGRCYDVGPGDCLATGMGHHHDFPIVHEPVKAVYFETTMEGRKRRGHLREHTHGPAEPVAERI